MTTQPDPFGGHLSYALAAAHRTVTQLLNLRLKKHSIQIEAWRVMECLDQGEMLTMGELAKRALLNPSALSKLVDGFGRIGTSPDFHGGSAPDQSAADQSGTDAHAANPPGG